MQKTLAIFQRAKKRTFQVKVRLMLWRGNCRITAPHEVTPFLLKREEHRRPAILEARL